MSVCIYNMSNAILNHFSAWIGPVFAGIESFLETFSSYCVPPLTNKHRVVIIL